MNGKIMLPVHWATFDLSYHSWNEPILRTVKASNEKSVSVITPRIGELFEYGSSFKNMEWYKN